MGKKADKLRRRFEHRLEEISEQFEVLLALVALDGEPLAGESAAFEAELRTRLAEIDARSAESLVALRERAEVQTDEEVARWSTAASGRIDDALRAIDEQADVVAGQVANRAAEVLAVAERTVAEAQERSRQCLDGTGVLEAELRTRLAEIDARSAESLVALRERAEVQTDEEVARWSTAASGRIDDALRAIDEQADVVAGQVASRAAEVLAVAERTVAEAQERASQRLDDTGVLEDELRTRLTEHADAMAGQVASRMAEILSAAERTVAEAETRALLRLEHSVASIEQRALEAPKDITPDVPMPAGVLEWRALSDSDSRDASGEPLTNVELDGGCPPSDDDDFFGRMAAELREEESQRALSATGPGGTAAEPVAVGPETVASHPSSALAIASRGAASGESPAEPVRRRALTVRLSLAALAASTDVLARYAADARVRIEVVHVAAGGRADSFLRLTAYNMSGWWEYHDVPADVTAKTPQSAVVDLGELANALQHERQQSDDTEVVVEMDGDLTIGTTLLLDHPDLDPLLPYHRERIELVDLRAADRSGLSVETQIGRVSIPPRLVSFLRTRNYRSSEILSVAGEPCLAAEIAGPTEGTVATIITRLGEVGAPLDESAEERRNAAGTEVTQLVRALSPDTTGEELEQILHGGVGYARRRAAAHPALPPAVIHGLINDGTEAIRAAAASNPSADEASCTLAAADGSEIVRAALAANAAVAAECLERLAADPVAHVREHAAANVGATCELLARLAEDADSSVRAAAAAHPGIEPETLSTLAHDPDSKVCAAVAGNPSCPSELLSELLALVPDAVLANPSAPSTVLAAGSRIDARRLRTAVAANPATPAKQLQSLARDGDPDVVRAVVENPATPANVRRRARRRLVSIMGDPAEAR